MCRLEHVSLDSETALLVNLLPNYSILTFFQDSYAFHLLSHSAVGCANPTFYQILHDDNNIELENMVNMTYALTMATQRCNKS